MHYLEQMIWNIGDNNKREYKYEWIQNKIVQNIIVLKIVLYKYTDKVYNLDKLLNA